MFERGVQALVHDIGHRVRVMAAPVPPVREYWRTYAGTCGGQLPEEVCRTREGYARRAATRQLARRRAESARRLASGLEHLHHCNRATQ